MKFQLEILLLLNAKEVSTHAAVSEHAIARAQSTIAVHPVIHVNISDKTDTLRHIRCPDKTTHIAHKNSL